MLRSKFTVDLWSWYFKSHRPLKQLAGFEGDYPFGRLNKTVNKAKIVVTQHVYPRCILAIDLCLFVAHWNLLFSCYTTGARTNISFVYWTVHHLDSWVKGDQLDATCFISLLNAQHVSDVNTSILRSLRLMCWVITWVALIWFDVCWCYVVVSLWWCGIRMQAEALEPQPQLSSTSASACIRIPHHHSDTTM